MCGEKNDKLGPGSSAEGTIGMVREMFSLGLGANPDGFPREPEGGNK